MSILSDYALSDKEGNEVTTEYKNNVGTLYITKNGTKYEIKSEDETGSYYIEKNGNKEYIEQELEKLLENLKKENYLNGLSKSELSKRLAYYLSELNVLHPFREGNGRTNREFIRQLALKNGYRLNLKKVAPEETLEASIKSIVDTNDLEKILEECLEEING